MKIIITLLISMFATILFASPPPLPHMPPDSNYDVKREEHYQKLEKRLDNIERIYKLKEREDEMRNRGLLPKISKEERHYGATIRGQHFNSPEEFRNSELYKQITEEYRNKEIAKILDEQRIHNNFLLARRNMRLRIDYPLWREHLHPVPPPYPSDVDVLRNLIDKLNDINWAKEHGINYEEWYKQHKR